MEQMILANNKQLKQTILDAGVRKLFLVYGHSAERLAVYQSLKELERSEGIQLVPFCAFLPNPSYDSVEQGVALFRREQCDGILAIGGGSAMDVAKCVKLYCGMEDGVSYLKQTITPNDIPFFAVPTTAGSGSEATCFAVVYENGVKQSVAHPSAIPSAVLLDASVLDTLPLYQRKATMLDALCHSLESCWSVHANDESREYAKRAIALILANADAYLKNDSTGNQNMLTAANLAGKAINITKTTGGHAMCYQLTSLYGFAHGHAAALCVAGLWPYMAKHMDRCSELEQQRLKTAFATITQAMGCQSIEEAIETYLKRLDSLELEVPVPTEEEYEQLKRSVNPDRLKNNPMQLGAEEIETLYRQMFTPR